MHAMTACAMISVHDMAALTLSNVTFTDRIVKQRFLTPAVPDNMMEDRGNETIAFGKWYNAPYDKPQGRIRLANKPLRQIKQNKVVKTIDPFDEFQGVRNENYDADGNYKPTVAPRK